MVLKLLWSLVRMPAKKLKKKTPFCYFAVPDDDTTHAKIEVC